MSLRLDAINQLCSHWNLARSCAAVRRGAELHRHSPAPARLSAEAPERLRDSWPAALCDRLDFLTVGHMINGIKRVAETGDRVIDHRDRTASRKGFTCSCRQTGEHRAFCACAAREVAVHFLVLAGGFFRVMRVPSARIWTDSDTLLCRIRGTGYNWSTGIPGPKTYGSGKRSACRRSGWRGALSSH